MRVFIFTTCFAPSIGGIERLTEMLATQFVDFGHEVVLATLTPGEERGSWGFPVVRRPSLARFWSLLEWCDVHLQANLSLKYCFARAAHRPFFVSHQCQYERVSGRRGLRDLLKLGIAGITRNIAASRFVAGQFRRCTVVPNPYDETIFVDKRGVRDRDLVFVGRLVSQKGCHTLIEALVKLRERRLDPSSTIVGDGPERPRLEAMVAEHRLSHQVVFAGPMAPSGVAELLNRHRILVVPSCYREPFGIVALEGLACGCLPVVSRHGGLVEAIGGHGAIFDNGCAEDLARVLADALLDWASARARLGGVAAHLAVYTSRYVAADYIEVFHRALSGRS